MEMRSAADIAVITIASRRSASEADCARPDERTMKLTTHPLGPDLDLPRVAPDQQLAVRLRQSFSQIVPAAELFSARFYARLFAAAPDVRPLFPKDMQQQQVKLF